MNDKQKPGDKQVFKDMLYKDAQGQIKKADYHVVKDGQGGFDQDKCGFYDQKGVKINDAQTIQ